MAKQTLKPNIFDFLNFREYLEAFLNHMRCTTPSFSFQMLVEKYGLTSRSHYIDILKGRTLTEKFIAIYEKICALNKKEREYFRALVNYEQSGSSDQKRVFFKKIVQLSPNLPTIKLEQEAYVYFSQWYYPVMLSVLDVHKHENDHKKIAQLFSPAISAVQTKKALKVLCDLQFISWNTKQNVWIFNNKFLQCTNNARVSALRGFHAAMQEMGIHAYKNNFENQSFSTLTLSTSVETKNEIEQMIIDFRARILEKVRADVNSDVAFQVNFQLFDVSKIKHASKSIAKRILA